MNGKLALGLMLVLSLAACQLHEQGSLQSPDTEKAVPRTVSSAAQSGPAVAAALTARYLDVRANCGSASMPAFLCRGIILRSTVPSTAYKAWNPSPHSQNSGGVSFSYLSADSKFTGLVFRQKNGFIFHPVLNSPIGTAKIEILCAFPIDGGTTLRDKPGCGAHPYDPVGSRRCQTVGITTAEQWVARWNQYKMGYNMCSFDVRDSMNNLAADSFYQSIRAHNLANFFAGLHDYIELILATWPQDIPSKLPIQAFFYLNDGLAGAQYDQTDFFKSTGIVIPIIKITLPVTPAADAVFTFNPADQVEKECSPNPENPC
ncbi:halovibrin HvnA [Pseudomonas gozinkensis]|uniref:halovibrin HvnA n=1 Tax=Pseudomonas gozinkensis TaxID=2774461 RepID=UPI0017887585|nr:halovibrin HvnA [Pseudomonas gozinkensis]